MSSMRPEEPKEIERLRTALADSSDAAGAERCPEAGRIWAAAGGELSASATRDVVEHTTTCGACAEAWRLAADLNREIGAAMDVRRAPRFGHAPRRLLWSLAAAAVVTLAAGLLFQLGPPRPSEVPSFREAERTAIHSLLPEATPLSRAACVLRWSPGPEGSRYEVRVTTGDLIVLTKVAGLPRSELRLPESVLARLPRGSRILWQVEAVLPNGSRLTSPTFVNKLD